MYSYIYTQYKSSTRIQLMRLNGLFHQSKIVFVDVTYLLRERQFVEYSG